MVSYIDCPVPSLSKPSHHVLLTDWWLQPGKMRMYLRTYFVDGLLNFAVLSCRSPLLQYVHRGGLDARCCLPLHRFHRDTECFPRTCNKYPKQYDVQTSADVFLNLRWFVICILCTCLWQNYLYFSLMRRTTGLHIPSTIQTLWSRSSYPFSETFPLLHWLVLLFVSQTLSSRSFHGTTGCCIQGTGKDYPALKVSSLYCSPVQLCLRALSRFC